MPLRYYRSTPSQYGDWPFASNGPLSPKLISMESRSPSISSKEVPDVPNFNPFPSIASRSPSFQSNEMYEAAASDHFTTPSLIAASQSTLPAARSPTSSSKSPPGSLRSLILVESNLESLRFRSINSSTEQFEKCQSDLPSDKLFRLSVLDALRREAFVEAQCSYSSSISSPAQLAFQSASLVDEPCMPSPLISVAMAEDEETLHSSAKTVSSPKNDFLELRSEEDMPKNAHSVRKTAKSLSSVFRRRNHAEKATKNAVSLSPPCPPFSFLDMDDDEETRQQSKSRLSLARLNPFSQSRDSSMRKTLAKESISRVNSQMASSVTSASSDPAPKSIRQQLQRTFSRPVALVQSRSAHTLDLSSSRTRSSTKQKKILPTLPSKKNEKRKSDLKSRINVRLGSDTTINEVHRANDGATAAGGNALGLHDAHGEAIALGDHLSQNSFFHFPSPCSPSVSAFSDSPSSNLDHVQSMIALDSPLSSSSIMSFSTCEEMINALERDILANRSFKAAARSPSNAPIASKVSEKARKYAKYSPPSSPIALLQPISPPFPSAQGRRLPSASHASLICLKEIRSSSVGSGDAVVPQASTAVIVDGEPISTLPHSETKSTISRSKRASRRRVSTPSPPPFPPPTGPLPPLPTHALDRSSLASAN